MPNIIFVIDDEKMILNMLRDHFETEGYIVYTFSNGKEAVEKLAYVVPNLILLDINMPGADGFTICSMIREHISCPIIFLTAKVMEQDIINGFHVGADDYITKPFSLTALTARVEAHLRREQRALKKGNSKFGEDLVIDYQEYQVFYKNMPISFSKTEFEIIKFLSFHAGSVFSRESIYEHVWGYDGEGDSMVVKEHIRRIRNKFLQAVNKEYIETVWGVGYKWHG